MSIVKKYPIPFLVLVIIGLLFTKPIGSALLYYSHSVTSGYGLAVGFDAPYRRLANVLLESIAELRNIILPERRVGLPEVRLYVTESAQSKLLENIPQSISNWQRAKILYPGNELRPIKVRHRGDSNAMNFVLTKKSWRIKTKKSRLLNNQRVINYIYPQTEDMIEEVVITKLARRLGVLAPMVRPVELFVNDRSHGILYETQHLDESFLRSNNFMAVNLYKGDGDRDSPKGLNSDLFQSSALWKKLSINNRYAKDDKQDLINFLELIHNAGQSDADFKILTQLAPYEIWAKFAAFQIMIQSWHNNSTHNQRLVIDDQSGTISPILWDTGFLNSFSNGFKFSFGSQPLLSLYLRDSKFLLHKLNFLYRFVIEEKAFDGPTKYLNEIAQPFIISSQRDSGRFATIPVNSLKNFLLNPREIPKKNRELQSKLSAVEKWLVEKLTQKPDALWQKNLGGGLSLFIDGILPIDQVKLSIGADAKFPKQLNLDINGNGQLDQEDIEIPFSISSGIITLDATWLANRTNGLNKPINYGIRDFRETGIRIVPTAFTIMADVPLAIHSVEARNPLTKMFFQIARGSMNASGPYRRNRPILPPKSQPTQLWSGLKTFNQVTVIDHPIRIAPGTTIQLAGGASLIFKNKIIVDGEIDRPVQVIGKDDTPWGTFALVGKGTSGSSLRQIHLSGGSGAYHEAIKFTAMLSIHSTSNILLDGINLANNQIEDDMMHIVYSDKIQISNINLENSFSDAIDIDISNVNITGGIIKQSGNDCLDLMTSKVSVYNLTLSNCKDKGVSVGENSKFDIVNSVIQNSSIAVEAKDRSEVNILHSNLLNNEVQANAYKKNWRYNDGGEIMVSKSFLVAPKNTLKTDKKSNITIDDSAIVNNVDADRRVNILKNVDFFDNRDTRSKTTNKYLFHKIPPALLSKVQGRRGVAPK